MKKQRANHTILVAPAPAIEDFSRGVLDPGLIILAAQKTRCWKLVLVPIRFARSMLSLIVRLVQSAGSGVTRVDHNGGGILRRDLEESTGQARQAGGL